jgi:hypothetical protein
MVKPLPSTLSNGHWFRDQQGVAKREAVGFSRQAFRQRLKCEAQEAI